MGFSLYLENPEIIEILDAYPTETPVNTSTPSFTPTQTPSATSTVTLTPSITPTSTPTPPYTLIVGNNTNLQSGPGSNFNSARVAEQGENLPVYGRDEQGTWLLVDPQNYYWIRSSIATLNAAITEIPILPTATPSSTPTITDTPTATHTFPSTPTRTLRPTNTPVPTKTPRPTATPIPTKTPIPAIRLNTIYNNYESMTTLQFSQYKREIIGKPVRETVKIGQVDDNGKVILSGAWSPFLINIWEFCVVVNNVPKDIAINLNGGDTVPLEATINGLVGDYNYYYNCKNALLLNYVKIGK